MEFIHYLIDSALLGTDKRPLEEAKIPAEVLQAMPHDPHTDEAARWLEVGAVLLNYFRAGVRPVKISVEMHEAPAEVLPPVSAAAAVLLQNLLAGQYPLLTRYWLDKCAAAQQIVPHDLLPDLLGWGRKHQKTYGDLLQAVSGLRGAWLAKVEPEQIYGVAKNQPKEPFEYADRQTRDAMLTQLRTSDPQEAIIQIQSIWHQENASSRVELLDSMLVGLSLMDEPFLVWCQSDKSLKVRQKALELLKRIPQSAIIQKYKEYLRRSIPEHIARSGGHLVPAKWAEDLLATGISTMSEDKHTSDDVYVLQQLIAEVEPDFWTTHFGMDKANTASCFACMPALQPFRRALSQSIVKFEQQDWALLALEKFGTASDVKLLQILPPEDLYRCCEPFLTSDEETFSWVFQLLGYQSQAYPWPERLVRLLITQLSKPDRLHRLPSAERMGMSLSDTAGAWLEQTAPMTSYQWENWKEEVIRVTKLKSSINQAFV